jgi:hypothetical protein
MRFIIGHNDQEVLKSFLEFDENKGYTRHLLTSFANIQKFIHEAAYKAAQRDKIFKQDLPLHQKFEKNHNIKCKVSDKPQSLQNSQPPEQQLTYQPVSTRKFKAKFLEYWNEEDYCELTEQPGKVTKANGDSRPGNATFDSQNGANYRKRQVTNLDKNFEVNLIDKLRFIRENLDGKMVNIDGNKSDDTMGDVDELRYDSLYAKSMVLRRKMNIL